MDLLELSQPVFTVQVESSEKWCPQGSVSGLGLYHISLSDTDSGVDCALTKFPDDTKLSDAFNTPRGKDLVQRDLDRLERPVTTAFENFEFPLDMKESMFLLLDLHGLLSVASHHVQSDKRGPFCCGAAEGQRAGTDLYHITALEQNCTSWDSVVPTHEMICELETQGVVSKPHSPLNSPIWPVCESNGEWKLTADYHDLNEAMPPLSTAVLDVLELQYGLESKAAK
ncbi:hypothetical protein HGM15179_012360 [Zosterops borbonicus]|uniref:Uncharacterized protein n=1 Tax=Zosterops borbonicus TaxID=364589 RepID=A0A8K1GAM9_9PASS|nr:hypothetical protein HGM15179_012360 [Zosterops borbonicus]